MYECEDEGDYGHHSSVSAVSVVEGMRFVRAVGPSKIICDTLFCRRDSIFFASMLVATARPYTPLPNTHTRTRNLSDKLLKQHQHQY